MFTLFTLKRITVDMISGHFLLVLLALQAPAAATQKSATDSFPVPRLFRSEVPLAVTLKANFGRLKDDKDDKSPYRAASVSYVGDSGTTITIPIRVKTHGIWRLHHCDLPPLRWNFANKDTKGTVFHGVNKPKVTNTCRVNDRYEQLVLQEAQLYRIYQLLTPQSHRVRVLRITYVDSASGKTEATRYAFAFEDPDQLAERLHGKMAKEKGATANDLAPEAASIVYLFQYLIGNTDFSFNGLHNGELVGRPDGTPHTPIAYDFDFSGAVNAPYATPDPKLNIRRVRDRLFRGYCAFNDDYPAAIELFKEKKSAIYALYHDQIGKLIDEGTVQETLKYFDEFYDTIKDARSVKGLLSNGCQGQR